MPVNYLLKRQALHNVDDIAGRWQHEGGDVFLKEKQVGHYVSYKRVTFKATEAQNTAHVTLTLLLEKSKTGAPENITLQGAHDFNSGNEIGSVSAASLKYHTSIGKNFVRVGDAIKIG